MTKDKKYFVNFGPELLQLLGPNLYTNIYYVLGEIIANAYDADAKNVYILYHPSSNYIRVEDDGLGMSYQDINKKFLPIGVSSRNTEKDSLTPMGRKKMGRKGIGKLAALSVAKKVKIMSLCNGEKSGCVLSLDITKNADQLYEIPSISEEEIKFYHIESSGHGSAIEMEESRYSINKNIETAKRNIALIFPFASKQFKIHMHNLETGKDDLIEDGTKEIIELSDTLLTFCDENNTHSSYLKELHNGFDTNRYYNAIEKEIPKESRPAKKTLNIHNPSISEELELETNEGRKEKFRLEIVGWISTYASTHDKKKNDDFPVNHISIVSNEKLGQFDILPEITTDRMQEAYVVGQFYVDLLEETSLPDISASNRQGYKSDDLRFIKVKELIREFALNKILNLKQQATEEKNYLRDLKKQLDSQKDKDNYNKVIKSLLKDKNIARAMRRKSIRTQMEKAYELKNTVTANNKKVLISHISTEEDKKLIRCLEKILIDCGFTKQEILYTSSDFYECRIPGAYTDIFNYLQEFFVNTVKRNDLCVIYVLNKNFIQKWNPTLEAGAGWVLNTEWFPMYTDDITSVLAPFVKTEYMPVLKWHLNQNEVHYLANALYQICLTCGKSEASEESIVKMINLSPLTD